MLTKKFFEVNSVKEFSAQRMVYSSLSYDGLEEIASELSKKLIKRGKDEAELLKKELSTELYLK